MIEPSHSISTSPLHPNRHLRRYGTQVYQDDQGSAGISNGKESWGKARHSSFPGQSSTCPTDAEQTLCQGSIRHAGTSAESASASGMLAISALLYLIRFVSCTKIRIYFKMLYFVWLIFLKTNNDRSNLLFGTNIAENIEGKNEVNTTN